MRNHPRRDAACWFSTMQHRDIGALLPESNINQQFLSTHVHNIAERSFAVTAEVQGHAALADVQIADSQVVEPVGQHRIHDI